MAVRTIGTDIKLTGEKAFNDGMKAMNANLKNLRTDMAAVSAEFDENANSVEALSAKQKILQESVDQHRAKVDALRQMYEKQVAAYGENSHGADKYKQALNQATVALNKESAALAKNAAALAAAKAKSESYTPVTQKLASALKKPGEAFANLKKDIDEAIHELPVFAEMADIAGAGVKGLQAAAKGTGAVLKGIGTAAGGVAKGVGLISAASAAGVAAIGAGGVIALTTMANMAREAAEAAKAAQEAGEALTSSQEQWLAYSNQLDALDSSVASAKSALAGVLLPLLGDLSTEGAAFLNDFSRDMTAAAGDAGKQTKVLSDYIVKGAQLIKQKLPEYIKVGKELFGGLGEGLSESGPELLDIGLNLVMELLDGIIDYAPELAQAGTTLIQKLTEGLIEQGPDLLTAAVDMVTQITLGLAQAAPEMIPAAAQLVTQLILALIESAPDLLLAGLELVYGIISGIADGLDDIIGSADLIISTIVGAFGEKAGEFLDIGLNIVKGIWSGISSGTDWIFGKISGWVGDVLAWIKKKFGIASPSKLMEDEVGFWLARGVGTGWEKEMKNVNRLIADSINTSFNVPDISVRSLGYSGRNFTTATGKTFNFYFYAKTITEADIKMVCDYVNRELGDDL